MGLGSIGKILGGAAGGLNWLSAATSLIDTATSIYGANKSAKTAKQNTAAQLNWEQQKAQNSIQWAVKDAIKAGINPAVAVGQSANAGSITPQIPDTSGYTSAGQALQKGVELLQNQQAIDAKAQSDRANARKTDVETGLKPKEVAIEEANADAKRMEAETKRQEAFSFIQRMQTLLPGETFQQKQEILQKAMDITLQQENLPGEISETRANNGILKLTNGLISLRDMKQIVAGITAGGLYSYQKNKDRTSSEKIARERNTDFRTRTYNSKGKLQSETYHEYRNN